MGGCYGYVPSSYLQQAAAEVEEAWQDEEYFGSYGTLVSDPLQISCFAANISVKKEVWRKFYISPTGFCAGAMRLM